MAGYHLQTVWRIDPPLNKAYGAIGDSLRWQHGWPSVRTVEQIASGDLFGIGCWKFVARETLSIVQHEWQVRSTCRWTSVRAPVARSIVIRNHVQIVARGARALAGFLDARLVAREFHDLTAMPAATRAHILRRMDKSSAGRLVDGSRVRLRKSRTLPIHDHPASISPPA